MPSVADLVEPQRLQELAPPAVVDAGRALAQSGAVALTLFGPLRVQATVADAGDHRVDLQSTNGLSWSCDCEQGQQGAFCRHCVATALVTWDKAPRRR